MIERRDTLDEALTDTAAGALAGAASVVVSEAWWSRLSAREQDTYRTRAEQAGIHIHADDAMNGHYVEIGDAAGPPLSSERPA